MTAPGCDNAEEGLETMCHIGIVVIGWSWLSNLVSTNQNKANIQLINVRGFLFPPLPRHRHRATFVVVAVVQTRPLTSLAPTDGLPEQGGG